jgi:LPS sulfotransferase NodH
MLDKFQFAINNPRSFLLKQSHRFFKIFGHHHYRRFIILARGRTGSNLLISYLRSHAQIHAQPLEIFSKLNGRSYQSILNEAFSKEPFYVKAAGFKMMYSHPLDDHDCGIWDELENMEGLHVIHLKRRNMLRSIVSMRIAKKQGVWLSTQKGTPEAGPKKVRFEKKELEEMFLQTKAWQNNGAQTFRNHPILDVYYEDLTTDRDREMKRIADFLGVHQIKPRTILKKQNPENLSSLVENYAELKNDFAGTEWHSHFED